jgi:ADP-heptose:LPS heptosyltransferase
VRLPRRELVLLGKQLHADLLNGRPSPVDRTVVIPMAQGVGAAESAPEAELQSFFEHMRAERFDLALQMHGGGKFSNPFVLQLGASLTAGPRSADAVALDRWLPYVYLQAETLRYLEVAGLVGAPPTGLVPQLSVTPNDARAAAPIMARISGRFAVLHPGASDPRRRWPVESFAAVAKALAGAGLRPVITGSPPERELLAKLAAQLTSLEPLVCDVLTIGGLAALLSEAAVVVSNDTGPLHLAMAVGAPVVGIFWCANFINGGPLMRARHRAVVSWRLDCPVCGATNLITRCGHDPSFVDQAPITDVISEALDLVSH